MCGWGEDIEKNAASSICISNLLSHEALSIRLLFEPLPQRVSVRPVHVNLTEHVKLSVVRLSKLLDLSLSAGLLQGETGPGHERSTLSTSRTGKQISSSVHFYLTYLVPELVRGEGKDA